MTTPTEIRGHDCVHAPRASATGAALSVNAPSSPCRCVRAANYPGASASGAFPGRLNDQI